MCAPVWRLWFTLETCQKPGPRRCGVTSSRMLVEGGLMVLESTVTERSTTVFIRPPRNLQAAQKGSDARRRPKVAREAYSPYVERATEGANEADGPFSAACYGFRAMARAAPVSSTMCSPVSARSAR